MFATHRYMLYNTLLIYLCIYIYVQIESEDDPPSPKHVALNFHRSSQ
jgi:hypothetical protein